MIYLFNDKLKPNNAKEILKRARSLAIGLDIVLRDIRVATHFLEIDVSLPHDSDLAHTLSLLRQIGPVIDCQKIEDKYIEKKESLEYGRNLFNSQKYWRAHEVLEATWKRSESTEKQILNAIILMSAAFVHYQKDENDICISILERALRKLDNVKGNYFEIDLDKIKAEINKIIKTRVIEELTI